MDTNAQHYHYLQKIPITRKLIRNQQKIMRYKRIFIWAKHAKHVKQTPFLYAINTPLKVSDPKRHKK